MKRNRRKNALTQKGAYLKTRIARNRGRAQFVGIVYLLSIIVLAAAACLPLFDLGKQTSAPVGVFAFWKEFMPANLKAIKSWSDLLPIVNAGIYALMLLIVVINVFRALGKLGWLFKKKASKTYGFNRNVYAMEDLGDIFSGSFAVILSTYFLAAVCLCTYLQVLSAVRQATSTSKTAKSPKISVLLVDSLRFSVTYCNLVLSLR